jgi:hypothetical protein
MSFFHRGILIAGIIVFCLGFGLYLKANPPAERPPVLTERSQKTQTQVQDPTPAVETLAAPWFRVPPSSLAPSHPPQSNPVHVDKASVTFVGSYKDQKGLQTFFFKYLPTDQVIILRLGETGKGWTLKAIGDSTFTLLGPGGQYEVTR